MAGIADIIAQNKMGPSMMGGNDNDADDQEGNVEFNIPQGYQVPSGVEPGDEFTAVGTFVVSEDDQDMLELTKIDGVPLEKQEPEPEQGA